jgi:Holliday junction resolvase
MKSPRRRGSGKRFFKLERIMILKSQHLTALQVRLMGSSVIGETSAHIAQMENNLEELSNDPRKKYGFRVEGMFAYVAAALGKCKLIKQEDLGGICIVPDNNINIPDYRIVLLDGQLFLVEVKNRNDDNIFFKKDYIDDLKKYAQLNNCPLKIAIYWSKFKIWTLIPADSLTFSDQKCELKMDRAMAISEMAILGDQTIGTKPPLKIRLNMDATQTSELNEGGQSTVTIGGIDLFSGNKTIEDPIEQKIAFQLIMSGRWLENESVLIENNKVSSIEYSYEPEEYDKSQGFALIGELSHIISANYDLSTVREGKIERFLPQKDPENFQVLIPDDYKGKSLPLWRLILQPNKDYQSKN